MDNQDKKVLIVERDTGIANMIRAILGIVNVQVAHAQTGQDAITMLTENSIGLMICEKEIPDMDGYNLLKYLRAKPETAQIPFLMLIAETDNTHLSLPPQEAADRYITKPFTARKVLDVVKEFIVYKGL